MATYFISDLHLSTQHADLTTLATTFLTQKRNQSDQIDALYILGDLFNTWLGDDLIAPEFDAFINALQHLKQQGIPCYFMVGNRDFMAGKRFCKLAGLTLLAEPHLIDLDGIPTLLMHGDSLCTDDISYQRYRKWVRTPILQAIAKASPRYFRQKLSDKIKQKSREQKTEKTYEIMDVNQAEVERVMQQYNVSQLIHGHTHRPAVHPLTINGKPAKRIVLGDWGHGELSFLSCQAGEFDLVDPRVSL